MKKNMNVVLATVLLLLPFCVQTQPSTVEEYKELELRTFIFVMKNPTNISAFKEYLKVVKQGFKQSWAEHNPEKYNLLQTGIGLAAGLAAGYGVWQGVQGANAQPQGNAPANAQADQYQYPAAPGGPVIDEA